MLRSFASAAGAATTAASAAKTMNLRMLPPLRSWTLQRTTSLGSAARGIGAPREDADAGPVERDQHGCRVVRVRALAEHTVGVRPVDEDVPPGRHVGDVDRLPLLRRDVVVAEAGRDPLADRLRAEPAARAVARPDRNAVQRARLVGVVQTEAGLAVMADEAAVAAPELVALKPLQVPVCVSRRAHVAKRRRQRIAP